jgi:hypothetical protein
MEGALWNDPPENGVGLQGILHFIGWLVAIILPWCIGFQVDHFLPDYTPLLDILAGRLVLLAVALGITAFFFRYGVLKFEVHRAPGGRAETEAWFRTHWPNMPSNCQITAIEPAASYGPGGIPASTRIRINDGHGFRVNLYYDLRTMQMLACRAYPMPP